MQAYKDKLHAALREIAECPVSMRTVEQAAAVTDLLCRLDKLEDHDEPEAATFDRETAMQWAANMQNADGTAGPHWTMEQTTAVAESMGIQAPVIQRWAWGVTMNMMYSDYYPVAVEFGLNRPEFYAALATAFLLDKDGPGAEEKLLRYYEHVVK
jgi:hypothetical protein